MSTSAGSRLPYIWYSLWLKSLTHNHSTRAGPVRIHCVMTGVFGRKWKDCASVPKHWGFFKWTICKFWSLIKTHHLLVRNIINMIPYNGCSQMLHISLKTEKSFIAHPWCLLCIVGLEVYSAHDWGAATSGTARSSYLAWVGPVVLFTQHTVAKAAPHGRHRSGAESKILHTFSVTLSTSWQECYYFQTEDHTPLTKMHNAGTTVVHAIYYGRYNKPNVK